MARRHFEISEFDYTEHRNISGLFERNPNQMPDTIISKHDKLLFSKPVKENLKRAGFDYILTGFDNIHISGLKMVDCSGRFYIGDCENNSIGIYFNRGRNRMKIIIIHNYLPQSEIEKTMKLKQAFNFIFQKTN